MHMKKFLLTAAVLAVSTASQASIIPTLTGITPVGSDFQFSYQGYLAGDQGLVSGDQLDIFNFAGYVPGTVASPYPTVIASATTGNPSGLILPPGFVINPADATLVFTYTGPDYNTSGGPYAVTLFNGLSAESIYGTSTGFGAFSAVAEKNTGPDTGTTTYNTGYEDVPTPVPEPAIWALMLLGAGLSGATLRSRRKIATA
jgi:hypothetical protein